MLLSLHNIQKEKYFMCAFFEMKLYFAVSGMTFTQCIGLQSIYAKSNISLMVKNDRKTSRHNTRRVGGGLIGACWTALC